MQTFADFLLIEAKNTHLDHLEQLIFSRGVEGTKEVLDLLRFLRTQLFNNTQRELNVTLKVDGAPAVFAGIDPSDGKFFVAKKGIFNKNPKVYKTPKDVDDDIAAGDLNNKMKLALRYVPELGIKSGVYQGDFMFDEDSIKVESINGVNYYIIHPNTIAYAIPVNSELGKVIRAAKIGIVWHTTYTGDSFENMSASFGKRITNKFNKTKNVWAIDATYHDYSGKVTFTKDDLVNFNSILSRAGKLYSKMPRRTLDAFKAHPKLLERVEVFHNMKIRNQEQIANPRKLATELLAYLHDYFDQQIQTKKSAAGKQTARASKDEIMASLNAISVEDIAKVYEMTNLFIEAKHIIVDKLNAAHKIKTFVRTQHGFKNVGHEGFVAVSHLGNAVKLVNRLEFSYNNFSDQIVKGWMR